MHPCSRVGDVGDGIAVPYPEKMLLRLSRSIPVRGPAARREIFYIFCSHSWGGQYEKVVGWLNRSNNCETAFAG